MINFVANNMPLKHKTPINKKLSLAILIGIQAYCGHAALAQTSAESDLKGVVRSVIDSPTVYDTGLTMQNNFRNSANSIGPKEIQQAQNNLPIPVSTASNPAALQEINANKLNLPNPTYINTDLRSYGKVVVVSPRGTEAISLIRQLSSPKPESQAKTLQDLQTMASEGVPEAQNFIGYIYEYGLFGAEPNIDRAEQYYSSASQKGYGTATYNLATIRFFGKGGRKQDPRLAETLASSAADTTAEASYRVCGLASFVNYRNHNSKSGIYSKNCHSPLAVFGQVAYTKEGTADERIQWLKGTFATGVNDGFSEMVTVAMSTPPDSGLKYCRYLLESQYKFSNDYKTLEDSATRCYTTSNTVPNYNSNPEKAGRKQAIASLVASVKADLQIYKTQREANKTLYSISVPYLPFHQVDSDAWAKNMPKKGN